MQQRSDVSSTQYRQGLNYQSLRGVAQGQGLFMVINCHLLSLLSLVNIQNSLHCK